MLSLPLIIPRDDHINWYTPRHIHPPTSTAPSHPHAHPTPNDPHPRPSSPRAPPARSTRALLSQDETTIVQRKLNIRRFGAGWIRPPGIAKTYQATMDEEAERAEQEMLARREEQLAELAAAQEGEGRGEGMEGLEGEEGENEEERDLDEEVPEAEEAVYDDSELVGEDYDEDEEEEVTEAMGEVDEEELERMGMEERDLDDDIPEAGSYQHTDTEEEDSSDAEEDVNEGRLLGIGNRMSMGSAGFEEGRSSLLSASDLLDSSPVVSRMTGTRTFMDRLRGGRSPRQG